MATNRLRTRLSVHLDFRPSVSEATKLMRPKGATIKNMDTEEQKNGGAKFKDLERDRPFDEKSSEYKKRFNDMFGGLIDPGDAAGEMLSAAIDRTKTDAYLK